MFARLAEPGVITTSPDLPDVSTGDAPVDLVVSPDGKFVYVSAGYGYEINVYSRSAIGALTPLVSASSPGFPYGLAMSSNGSFLYVASAEGGNAL